MLFFIQCFLTQSVVYADDSFFHGEGVSVFPATGTKIRMVSEKVNLKVVKNEDVFATCDFYFNNPEKETEITMGFPAQPDEEDGEEQNLQEPDSDHIKDFKVFVNGQPVLCKLKKSFNKEKIPGLNFDEAFVWQVKMPQNKTVHVQHTYRFRTSAYYHTVLDKIREVSYILKTGALWDGKMDNAEISVDLGPNSKFGNLAIEPDGYVFEKGVVKWIFKNFKPTSDVRIEIHQAKELDKKI